MLAELETDYLIIGAGSAGCALGEGLSRNGRYQVTMLEAGGNDKRFWVQVPMGYGKTFYDPSLNWCYQTVPDPGLNNQSDYWPRGKIIGGSSAINAMVYARGHAADYDDWAKAGNRGWAFDDVLKVYKLLEDNQAGGDDWRGQGGRLHIADISRQVHPLCKSFFAAAETMGLPFNRDFNGASQDGVGHYQITTKNGRRLSSARAFLTPARANMRIETGALVNTILFEGNRAIGAEFIQNGKRQKIKVRGEVILSAGAVNSPQILQLSGIGPAASLQKYGIKLRHANDHVGQNLEDHIGLNYTFRATVATLNDRLRPWWGKLLAGAQYLTTGGGPLSLSINHAGGFFRSRPDLTRPDMQLYMQAFSTLIPKNGERPLLTPDPFSGFSIGLSSGRPLSRGHIEISSSDPTIAPRITANALSHPQDVADLLAAVKFIRRLAAQPPLANVIAEELRPGPDCKTDDELIADIRARSGTVFHPCCTCRMGRDAKKSVVNDRLQVHGIAGLRIADASVFPNIITGNTNAPAMMVGAKAADIILAQAA